MANALGMRPTPVILDDTGNTISLPLGAATESTLAKIPGLAIPIFDYCALSQNSTQDIWTFKTGGAAGTLVATVTITYTDTTKATISTVAKT